MATRLLLTQLYRPLAQTTTRRVVAGGLPRHARMPAVVGVARCFSSIPYYTGHGHDDNSAAIPVCGSVVVVVVVVVVSLLTYQSNDTTVCARWYSQTSRLQQCYRFAKLAKSL
jgi:hypothetical protein